MVRTSFKAVTSLSGEDASGREENLNLIFLENGAKSLEGSGRFRTSTLSYTTTAGSSSFPTEQDPT